VTSQGSPYGRFRRALDRQSLLEALASAAEMRHVALSDATELLLLMATKDPGKFPRAALKWHARYCHELRVYDPLEAQVTLGLLFMLGGPSAKPAALALAELLRARDFGQAAEHLVRWVS
jgi:hypothetical protein